ncbi:MAG: hypothetical protein AAGH71_06000 [Planctomycetota bacterium]
MRWMVLFAAWLTAVVASGGVRAQEPTAEERYWELVSESQVLRLAVREAYAHRDADEGPWYLDALLELNTSDLESTERIAELPVRPDRWPGDVHSLVSRARFHMQELAAAFGAPAEDGSIRAFALFESHRDAAFATGTLVPFTTLENQHEQWLKEQLASASVGPDAARELLDILSSRIELTPTQSGQRWTANFLVSNRLYDHRLAEYFQLLGKPYEPPGDFDRYRQIADQLGAALTRSIDAPAEFRLAEFETLGDLWFEGYSMQHDPPHLRDDESHSGHNRLVGAENQSRAEHRGMMINLAAIIYRAEHEQWPESLDDLVPDLLSGVPIDPYDAKPLRYERPDAGDGYVLYSVG